MKNKRKGDTRENISSRLIGCPFATAVYNQKKKGHWKFTVSNSTHNHCPTAAVAHTVHHKLSDTLYKEMKRLGEAGLQPAQILECLKKLHPDETILATIDTIYSA